MENAALNALVASGLSAQPFLFYGFLGSSEKERVATLQELKEYPQTLIFYEAPHRIKEMLEDLLNVFGDREIALAREITKKHEEFIRGTLSEMIDIAKDLKGEIVVVIEGNHDERNKDILIAFLKAVLKINNPFFRVFF